MKRGSHKNQIVITSLALLLAVVGYISYDNKDILIPSKDSSSKEVVSTETVALGDAAADETETEESILNAGETVLTSTISENADYAAEVKLGREQIRSKNKEALQQIIDNSQLSEAEKQGAVDEMVKLTQIAQMEVDAEMLLEAKGFKNVVVSISDKSCDIVVGKEDVTDDKRAQIEDIIKRKTNITASNIVITTID